VKTVLAYLLAFFLKTILWFRYRIRVKGLDKLNPETLKKTGGVLFLPSHPAIFVDPIAVSLAAWPRFPIRPMVVEYIYFMPVVNTIMKFLNALPVPNFAYSSNSLKRKKSEKVISEVIENLQKGENFLVYPAGKVKLSGYESIGGSSAAHQIIGAAPNANIVLVRIAGLWGSSFSSYYLGKTPPMLPIILQGIKFCLKNLLFFTPRREIVIEFEPAGPDFPYGASRVELNRYLEGWYNKPDGLSPQKGDFPGDSLQLISYSMWGEKHLPVHRAKSTDDSSINLAAVPEDVKTKVIQQLAEMTQKSPLMITPELNLSTDLGLDSLDASELSVFLLESFDIKGVPVDQLTTVGRVLGIASHQITFKEEVEQEADISRWKQNIKKERVQPAEGKTIPEIFLNNCARKGKVVACGDMRAGVMTYADLKLRVIMLAEYIRNLPGEYIGILLPASVVANVLILATQLACKTPLMINWTVGSRHLEWVTKVSNVQVVLSSWTFLDKLENVELDGIEDKLVMLEDVRRNFTLSDKIKAYVRSKMSTKSILKAFNADKLTEDSNAVLLFTSGTENMPKGVPLSHKNVASNLRAVFEAIDLYSDDVLFGILPPFHVFGFSISALAGLLVGMRLASSPDPTDSAKLAKEVEKWGVTVVCGAPTFLKGMLKSASPEQMKTLRLFVTGAEKAPDELFRMMEELGKGDAIIEGYGITECSPVLTANRVNTPHKGVGEPLPGVEICIVHPETHESVPIGGQGLILARGPNVFSGYINPTANSPFLEHEGKQWYITGDLGFLDEANYLTISGRLKRFIKIGGEMVSLSSIEDALLSSPQLKEWPTVEEGPMLAICAKEIPGDKTKIFLFTSFNMDVDQANTCLRKAGFSNLTRISNALQLKEIPIMGSGKVNYRALDEQTANL